MGITFSIMQKFGMPGMQSLSTDRVFDKYFGNNVKDFESFHIAFLNACSDFNSFMPGKHYAPPPRDEIKNCYEKWVKIKDDASKKAETKELILDLLTNHVSDAKDNNALVMTGMVAPPAAMVLKRAGQNLPQLKKFRLHLVPDVVFVPSCTLLALIGVKSLLSNPSSRRGSGAEITAVKPPSSK